MIVEVERAGQILGFTPALRMTGLLDTRVPPEHAEHLVAVLREALSNVARHAGATAVEIAAEVTDTLLELRVIDNGRGIDPAVTRRSGVANVRHRAEQLGGTLTLSPHRPTGTVLEWTVPLPEAGP